MNSSGFSWQTVLHPAAGEDQLEIRPFDQADLDQILNIERRAHQESWKRGHFLDSLKSSRQHCVGIRCGANWIGYAVVSCVVGEAELLLLVIDTAWQGRGIGRRFLQHICSVLATCADTLFLEVRAGNTAAIGLYEQLDFNQVGVRPNYYPAAGYGEDALIYARTLEPQETEQPVL